MSESPSLDAKVAALREPAAYPSPPGAIEAIETHMSWVFLTPEHAFKLKKPVRSDGLDFGTPHRRRFYCLEELRLNRRLAPRVYLDVLPLRQRADGSLGVGGTGAVVDWLVMMRRLPREFMLDRLLEAGLARPEHLREVAGRLAAFYRTLPPALQDPQEYRARLARQVDSDERKLCDPELAFDADEVRLVTAQLRWFVDVRRNLLDERVRNGCIVEGHGDLRPEHVWLGTPPAVIDCLEFSPVLRTVDSADEVGFLALECERAQAPHLAAVLLQEFASASGDAPAPALVHFYQALRACVRAAIALWHLKEARYHGAPVWRERAGHYLRLAGGHARQCLGGARL